MSNYPASPLENEIMRLRQERDALALELEIMQLRRELKLFGSNELSQSFSKGVFEQAIGRIAGEAFSQVVEQVRNLPPHVECQHNPTDDAPITRE